MLKILIVEDDLMIADLTASLLEGHYQVCGVARTIAEAVAVGQASKPDLALIDFRLANGDFGTDAAGKLAIIGITGILYTTASVSQLVGVACNGIACLSKPCSSNDLLRSLEIVCAVVLGGAASPPLPRGLHILSQSAAA